MSLSEKRLAKIREHFTGWIPVDDIRNVRYAQDLLAHVDHLTAENARLREEVDTRTTGQRRGEWVDPEGDYWRDYWHDRAMEAEEYGRVYRNFRRATEVAYALLNPTEGETDD